jgi:hypothetical protein
MSQRPGLQGGSVTMFGQATVNVFVSPRESRIVIVKLWALWISEFTRAPAAGPTLDECLLWTAVTVTDSEK